MSLTLSYEENKREALEAGNHIARCIQIIDLGTQPEKAFETGEDQLNHKIRITWEIPNEIIEWTDKETGEARSRCQVISQEFKASLHEKAKLRKMLASWRGRDFTLEELKGFNITKLLGVPCFLNVVHVEKDGNKYANISAVTPLAKGIVCPDQVTPSIYFDIDNFDQNIFDQLPKFIQEKINKSEERKSEIDLPLVNDDGTDYVPNQTIDTSNLPDPATTANELPEIDMDEINTPF
jgi:hypothetical protein